MQGTDTQVPQEQTFMGRERKPGKARGTEKKLTVHGIFCKKLNVIGRGMLGAETQHRQCQGHSSVSPGTGKRSKAKSTLLSVTCDPHVQSPAPQ